MSRQVILDTETTGISVDQGHRIIEIGCVEMIDRKVTDERFHCYLNPQRDVDDGAFAVHGISSASLQDKPLFSEKASKFIDFVRDAELIIHNAPFDVGFINNELQLSGQDWQPLTKYCRILDTLPLARKLHVGMRNNLDALCKRYSINNAHREYHGALLDAYLLAQVYLAMTKGQRSFLDERNQSTQATSQQRMAAIDPLRHKLVLKVTDEEQRLHEEYLQKMAKQGKCLWGQVGRDG